MDELATMNREQLLEEAKKYHVENAGEKSPEQLRKGIFENKQVLAKIKERNEHYRNLPEADFKNLLEQHNIEHVEEDIQDRSNVLIIELDGAIERKKMQDKISSLSFPQNKEEIKTSNVSPSDSGFYLDTMQKNPYEVGTDEYRDHENTRISHINNIRVENNLQPLPLYKSDEDLRRLLLCDRNLDTNKLEIGPNCQEYLLTFTQKEGFLRDNYRKRMEDILLFHNAQVDRENRAKAEQYQIEIEFQQFKHVPKKIINTSKGVEVNPSYLNFQEAVKKLYRKLTNKQKGYEAGSKPVPEYLKTIFGEVQKLYDKHIEN